MSQEATWQGPVACRWGTARGGCLAWSRRSLSRPAAAKTRYMVRGEARYSPRSSSV